MASTNSGKEYMFRFATLGESGVGKTAFLVRFVDNVYGEPLGNTLGVDFRHKKIVQNGKHICLNFWDTAGQERFRSITRSFFRNCIGFLLIFDVTDRRTFHNVCGWLEQIKENTSCEQSRVLLIGNKADLVDARTVKRKEAEELAKQHKLPYVETSAVTGKNVPEAIHKLLQSVLALIEKTGGQLDGSMYRVAPCHDSDALILNPTKDQTSCCYI